jgi:uroporphyrinogen decarboxylase
VQRELGATDADAWLANDVYQLYVPWYRWHELGSDWAGMEPPTSPPTVIGHGSYSEMAENAAKARADGKYVLAMVYASHFERAYFARGFENFMADIVGDFVFAKRLCQTIIQKNLVMLENFLHLCDIDGVLLGSDWGSQRGLLMSLAAWDEMIRPGEQQEYDLVHAYGKDVWVHSCGDVQRLIPRLIEMGLNVLNPVQPECMDIARLKADFGGRLTFWGGISTQRTLPFGSPQEVRQEARRVRDLMAQGGGYILSPSQAIQGDVPPANILALMEVAREAHCD